MIHLTNITKQHGSRVLFRGASMQILPATRSGLVGPNGAGKTTIFRLITGLEEPDKGEISCNKRTVIGYFSQEVGEMSGRSALAEVMAAAGEVTTLGEQIREMESSVETLKKLDEQEGVFCAPQTGTVESLQLMQGQTSGQVGGSISDPERGYQIRFALEAEDAVQDTAGVTVTVMHGAKSESVKINSSVSQQDGGVVLSAALTGSDWQVGKAELTIRLSETEYDCCLPVSALHSDNGGDFVYSVEERNTILGLQNIVRKVYVEVVERNNELAALRNYTTGAPVVAATTKSLQEGARVRTAG